MDTESLLPSVAEEIPAFLRTHRARIEAYFTTHPSIERGEATLDPFVRSAAELYRRGAVLHWLSLHADP